MMLTSESDDRSEPRIVRRLVDADAQSYEAEVEVGHDVACIKAVRQRIPLGDDEYLAVGLPVEFHCHGLAHLDFSNFETLSLAELDFAAGREGVLCVPTFYLPRPSLHGFIDFAVRFGSMRDDGALEFLPGFAVEGPMLGSFGGTPEKGVWAPTRREWELLAACGRLGLQYMVLSPDAWLPGSHLADCLGPDYPSLTWVVETLLAGGVRPALGHFSKNDPAASAAAIAEVLDVAASVGAGAGSDMVLTDHLFNDMPVKVSYAWRTPDAQARRDLELAALEVESWTLGDLAESIGEVPAALITAASRREINVCINFDGEHVDAAIARRAVELMGAASAIAMTDRTDVARLGGQELHRESGTNLWYQHGGIVAAGSTPLDRQRANMARVGLDEITMWTIMALAPGRVLARGAETPSGVSRPSCVVSRNGTRQPVVAEWALVDAPAASVAAG